MVISTLCMIMASVILTCMGYGVSTWQWWAIILLMVMYRLAALIEN